MDFLIIGGVAFLTSILTFFSGFGVGTILTPAFVLFFPIDIAVAMTAIVHFLNNLFKMGLTFKDINKNVLIKFGVTAIPLAFLGAWLLMNFSNNNRILYEFTIGDKTLTIKLVELIIGIMMLIFAIFELLPTPNKKILKNNMLYLGGAISGFFGGLSGHQGALRTIFLLRSGLTKESFIATGIAIACIVDVSRISIYFAKLQSISLTENLWIITSTTLCAFAGAFIGKKLLKKVTITFIQYVVAILIIIISVLLIVGII
ncbi:MAG: sulfite exporter TauE/SafE family protein [Vicingaceae bacterium]|nr:sulfite exporter TauE/SafE family protein [Vicingaceae bacterium]